MRSVGKYDMEKLHQPEKFSKVSNVQRQKNKPAHQGRTGLKHVNANGAGERGLALRA